MKNNVKKYKSTKSNVPKRTGKKCKEKPAPTSVNSVEAKCANKLEKLPEKPEDCAELIQDILRKQFQMCTFEVLKNYLEKRYESPVDVNIIRKVIMEEFRKGCLAIRPAKSS